MEIKPLVLTDARQSQVTKISVKQLLLWSQNSEIKPLVPIHARQSQVTKIGRKKTSACKSQSTVQTRPGRNKI